MALAESFAHSMAGFNLPEGSTLAVACSGGADSMALTLLAAGWAKAHHADIVALTVDHQLRKGSAAEAAQVAAWLTKRGIEHYILSDAKHKTPTANVEEKARELRYGLMGGWCKKHKVEHLLLAHHLDDQAETFLLRLGRGSGVRGLACMRPQSTAYGVILLRPLLDVPKTELVGYLREKRQKWVEDPSNQSDAHLRNAVRAALSPGGLPLAERLAETAKAMQRAEEALMHAQERFMKAHSRHTAKGLEVDFTALMDMPEETQLSVVADALCAVGKKQVRPRLKNLQAALHALHKNEVRTLWGCRMHVKKSILHITPEKQLVKAKA